MILGGLLLIFGAALYWAERLHFRFGPLLPGDILVKKGNLTIFLPVVTTIVLSLILTFLLNFWAVFKR